MLKANLFCLHRQQPARHDVRILRLSGGGEQQQPSPILLVKDYGRDRGARLARLVHAALPMTDGAAMVRWASHVVRVGSREHSRSQQAESERIPLVGLGAGRSAAEATGGPTLAV